MRLVATPDNPLPPEAAVAALVTADDRTLRAAHWRPRRRSAAQSRGTVVICQGRSEHIEKYFETAGELLRRGFCVVAFDWRGQGLSQRDLQNPDKGHVDDFALYDRDIDAVVEWMRQEGLPTPWFGLAHSMGGTILLRMAHAGALPFERMVLSAPLIDLYGLRFPRGARALAEVLDLVGLGGSFIPGGAATAFQTKPFAGNVLTSDPRRYARNAAILAADSALGVGAPTIGWTHAAFRQMRALADPEFPRRTLLPTLVVEAGGDRVVDNDAMERFATRLKAGRLVTIPYCGHEILMERDAFREQFWAAFDAFIPGTRETLGGLTPPIGPAALAEPLAS